MDDVKTEGSSNISEVSLDKIEPNPDQPRRDFDEDGLQEGRDYEFIVDSEGERQEAPYGD